MVRSPQAFYAGSTGVLSNSELWWGTRVCGLATKKSSLFVRIFFVPWSPTEWHTALPLIEQHSPDIEVLSLLDWRRFPSEQPLFRTHANLPRLRELEVTGHCLQPLFDVNEEVPAVKNHLLYIAKCMVDYTPRCIGLLRRGYGFFYAVLEVRVPCLFLRLCSYEYIKIRLVYVRGMAFGVHVFYPVAAGVGAE